MKAFFRILIMTGVPFGLIMSLPYSFMSGLQQGFTTGMISGLAFGLIMAIYVKIQHDKALSDPPVLIDEVLEREASAQLLTESKPILGALYLTDKRLVFEAYPGNFKLHSLSVPIHEISGVEGSGSLGIFSGKLKVACGSDRIETFVTEDAGKWEEALREARQTYLNEPRSDAERLFRE